MATILFNLTFFKCLRLFRPSFFTFSLSASGYYSPQRMRSIQPEIQILGKDCCYINKLVQVIETLRSFKDGMEKFLLLANKTANRIIVNISRNRCLTNRCGLSRVFFVRLDLPQRLLTIVWGIGERLFNFTAESRDWNSFRQVDILNEKWGCGGEGRPVLRIRTGVTWKSGKWAISLICTVNKVKLIKRQFGLASCHYQFPRKTINHLYAHYTLNGAKFNLICTDMSPLCRWRPKSSGEIFGRGNCQARIRQDLPWSGSFLRFASCYIRAGFNCAWNLLDYRNAPTG